MLTTPWLNQGSDEWVSFMRFTVFWKTRTREDRWVHICVGDNTYTYIHTLGPGPLWAQVPGSGPGLRARPGPGPCKDSVSYIICVCVYGGMYMYVICIYACIYVSALFN